MKTKKILQHNNKRFLTDLKKATQIMVLVSGCYLSIRKGELTEEAEETEINYYMTDEIFKIRRLVMVLY